MGLLHITTFKVFVLLGLLVIACSEDGERVVNTLDIAKATAAKGEELVFPGNYRGILYIQAMAEIGVYEGEGDYLDHVRALCSDFGNGQIKAKGNFICYEAAGSGAAYLVFKGLAPELEPQVLEKAQQMMADQPRSSEGLMTRDPGDIENETDRIFIDVAFAVTPYLLYTGLAFEQEEYIDQAVFETLKRMEILKDRQTGLVHQARGFQGKGVITQDNWSRGNGWAALGLATLIRDLPEDHPKRDEVDRVAYEYFMAVLDHQDENGLWHQEMSDHSSYVETSGSGLLLYALGVAIENGVLGDSHRAPFKKGLTNYLAYVEEDGSVSHTSNGYLARGEGTKEDVMQHPWSYNESHSFGAASLAFIQAVKLGIDELEIPFELGYIAKQHAEGNNGTN